jgi:hypothetical protein
MTPYRKWLSLLGMFFEQLVSNSLGKQKNCCGRQKLLVAGSADQSAKTKTLKPASGSRQKQKP